MRRFSALVALACVVAAVPAGAQEERAALAGKIDTAVAQATSYRVRVTSAAGRGSIWTMVRAQKRTKVVDTDPVWGVVTEMIFADGRGYTRTGGEWRVLQPRNRPAGEPSPAQTFLNMVKITPLPDRVENGVTVGAYQMDMHPPTVTPSMEMPVTFTCTYDKATYLPRSCRNDVVTETFEGWNDPANVVDVPVVAAPISR